MSDDETFIEFKTASERRAAGAPPFEEMSPSQQRLMVGLLLLGRSCTRGEIAAFMELWQPDDMPRCHLPEPLVAKLWAVLNESFSGYGGEV